MAAIQLSEPEGHVPMSHAIYRSSSPNCARLEMRIGELEERLEEERSFRNKNQRETCDLALELEALQERLDEANELTTQHLEVLRRREAELSMVQKERDLLKQTSAADVESVKRRNQVTINELHVEIEDLRRAKAKLEKDRAELMLEVEKMASELSRNHQQHESLEGKLEGLECHTTRLKAGNDDLMKQISEMNARNASLISTEAENLKALDRANTALGTAQRQVAALQKETEDLKRSLRDETTSREHLQTRQNLLQSQVEAAECRAEEEAETAALQQQQLSKMNAELIALRSKYEREVNELQGEVDDGKRRLNSRVNELTEQYEAEHSRVLSLERTKTQLTGQIHEIQMQLDSLQLENVDLKQELKSVHTQMGETQAILEEIQTEDAANRAKIAVFQKDLTLQKAWRAEHEPRLQALEKESRQLSEKNKELKVANETLMKENDNLEAAQNRLEREKESLELTITDMEESLQTAESRCQSAQNAITHLRGDLTQRLHEKDEELETLKRTSHRTIEDLNKALEELEGKLRTEAARWKKKIETSRIEFEKELNNLKDDRDEAVRAAQEAEDQCTHLLSELNEVQHVVEETRSALQLCENRRQALSEEVETLRVQYEASERNRRKAEAETGDSLNRVSELTSQMNTLTAEKRRLEGELAIASGDLEDLAGTREANEERINRLVADVQRLTMDLQTEQETVRRSDASRRQLETELRDANTRVSIANNAAEEAEKEARRQTNAMEARVRDLEMALESEVKKVRDTQTLLRKNERSLKEVTQGAEEERNMVAQLRELLDRGQSKLRTTRRQAEEAEAATAAAMSKFRKVQEQLEESELRATMAERRAQQLASANNAAAVGDTASIKGITYGRLRAASAAREGSTFSLNSQDVYYTPRRPRRATTFLHMDPEDRDLEPARISNGVA